VKIFYYSSLFTFLLSLLFVSCTTSYLPQQIVHKQYTIKAQDAKDTLLIQLMKPYKDSVLKNMSSVVGQATILLKRARPEGTLGNFVVDAMYYAAKKSFTVPIDIAIVNDDGIRIDQIAAGQVTRWDIFNIMPFENMMVLQQIKGNVLQQFLDLIAADKGWPVAGMTMQLQNGKAVNVLINGKPLEKDKIYNVINSDYIANGGKNAEMLKGIPQQNKGYLLRDAIFDYIKFKNNTLSAAIENRVTNAQ
jgi:2',3'-cyclic-nucleotide 2'-phosphodiesterase (5'-nucleotidase family)